MKISRIYAENYKTYRKLDLNLEVAVIKVSPQSFFSHLFESI